MREGGRKRKGRGESEGERYREGGREGGRAPVETLQKPLSLEASLCPPTQSP